MIIRKAPEDYTKDGNRFTIFLGGSIEMDKAERWQDELCERLKPYDILVLNPRRDSWDISIEQTINNPYFNEQVKWELDGIEKSDLVIMYLQPNTLSPITLLEIGLTAKSDSQIEYPQQMVVCCPDGFWRKGNVEIVCKRSNILLLQTKSELFDYVEKIVSQVIIEIK